MHRSWSAAVLVASLSLALAVTTAADSQNPLDQARGLLAKNDAQGAVVVLEEALTGEPTQRTAILELLRQAYTDAADEAEAAGNRTRAEMFRDNLLILNHKPKPAEAKERTPAVDAPVTRAAAPPELASDPGPSTSTGSASPESPPRPIAPISNPSPALNDSPAVDPPKDAASTPPQVTAPPRAADASAAAPTAAPPASEGRENGLAAADAAFTAKRYAEAGRLYMALAQAKKLPASRRDHLAYCRCAEVVRRINAKPATAAEWEKIDAEVRLIRQLSPNNWYVEYLRNLTAERSPSKRARPSQKVVVRGSAPEERPFEGARPAPGTPFSATPRAPESPAAVPEEATPVSSPPLSPSAPAAPEAVLPGNAAATVVSKWQIRETENFRIMHVDSALAERVAEVVESARSSQVKRWMSTEARGAWSPRCEVYVYPNAKTFSRMTGQNEESPGFSTMGMNGGRIVTRRINVRADHANLVVAVLPHEVTHVVLADLFPTQQIPRWADEGMAVLAEPHSEQQLRAGDLEKPLNSGQLFKLNDLMVMDYPDGKYWGLYYAQSVSLTRFLVEQGSPAQFIQFVQGSQKNGPEAELKRVYQINGFEDLQTRWLAYARSRSAELTADAASPTATTNR